MMTFRNKNEAVEGIERGIKEEKFKDCVNLQLTGHRQLFGYEDIVSGFTIKCREDCVAWYDDLATVGCPSICHLFRSRAEAESQKEKARLEEKRKEREQERREMVDRWLNYVATPFKWFSKLAWQTQFLLVLLLILIFAPRWVPKIIELIRAFGGK
jgi:hypothetical protein